jgi:tetratricopeptide (TPR) repeat protein
MPLVEGSPEMMDQATTLSQIFAETNPEDAMALAIYADFLTMNQKYEEAAKKYEASLLINNKTFIVWQQLLICQSQLNDFPAMLRTSTEALKKFFYIFFFPRSVDCLFVQWYFLIAIGSS